MIACALANPTLAQEVSLRIVSPGFTYMSGIPELAAGFQKETGTPVTATAVGTSKVMQEAKTGEPAADVIFLPVALMDQLEKDKRIVPGSRVAIGRVRIGLAMHKGDGIPDISTVEKLAATLKSADSVMYSNPASGSMEANIIDNMLKSRPEFAGIKTKISTHGEGGEAVARGEGQMALQLVCEIINHPDSLANAGPLPDELHAWIDGAAAVSIRSQHPKEAAKWLRYATQPGTYSLWLGRGLERVK